MGDKDFSTTEKYYKAFSIKKRLEEINMVYVKAYMEIAV